jgi:hypothetical protein
MQDLEGLDPSDRDELMRNLNAMKGNKNTGPSNRFKNTAERGCENRPLDTGKFTLTCYYCSIPGHMARDCFKKAKDLEDGGVGQRGKPRNVRSLQSDQQREDTGDTYEYGDDTGGTPKVNTIGSLYTGMNHLN